MPSQHNDKPTAPGIPAASLPPPVARFAVSPTSTHPLEILALCLGTTWMLKRFFQ